MKASLQGLKIETTKKEFSELASCWCIKHRQPMEGCQYSIFGKEPKVKWFCASCSTEREEKELQARAQQEALQKQHTINQRLHNAMIAPRFFEKKLENFNLDHVGQGKALEACRSFIANFEKSTGMIFTGKPGTGKNHLASAIGREVIESRNKTALMTTALRMLRDIKGSWSNGSEKEILRNFNTPDLLVIDEIGVQFGSETEKLYLTDIINERYEWMRPTILLTNLPIPKLGEMIGDRVIDRFREGGSVVVFDWESYRGKIK